MGNVICGGFLRRRRDNIGGVTAFTSYSASIFSPTAPPPYQIDPYEVSTPFVQADTSSSYTPDATTSQSPHQGVDQQLQKDMNRLVEEAWSLDRSFSKIEGMIGDMPSLLTRWKIHRKVGLGVPRNINLEFSHFVSRNIGTWWQIQSESLDRHKMLQMVRAYSLDEEVMLLKIT